MGFTGGQVDLDAQGNVRNPGNLDAQCAASMDYLVTVLQDLGFEPQDLVRLVVYFVGDAVAEAQLTLQLAQIIGDDTRPVLNLISLPELCYPGMRVEIEGVAMRGEDNAALPRRCLHLPDMPFLPVAFSHVVQCDDIIFTSDISAVGPDGMVRAPGNLTQQSQIMMEQLSRVLDAVHADMADVAKLNVWYVGDGTAQDWEKPAKIRAGFFPDPGPAATGMPVTRFADPDVMARINVTAMRSPDGGRREKTFAWPEGHWNWTTPLPYKHGNKCGRMIHVGGQVSLDAAANVIDPGDMVAQTRRAMENIANVLAEFDATLDDVVKVTTFYQGAASAKALHENLMIRSQSYRDPGPATTGIPMPALVYENMVIEIEVIAITDK
jgi:enamine deaminase RidA (YjgF/YER057c/UK114 family)